MQTTRTPYSVSFMATVLLLLLFACHSTIANAAVALGATRVIYPANQKQVLLPVTNNDPASVYLIQSWIENAGDQKDTQFVITPPLFSMQGKKENTLRIINATNHQLPGDRESLFWVNVKAIPAMEKDQKNENTLQLAIISRIKMFYRPTHLAMAPEEAPAMLRFRRSGSKLTLINPTPYFITVTNMKAGNSNLPNTMVPPKGEVSVDIPHADTRYALAMGEYRSGNNLQSTPKFVQASLMHGLKGNWTPYGGMQIAEDYQAFNLGIGKDLGLFGAFSFDITQANTTLADDTRHSGQSVKFVYSKSFYQTGTNIQVAGYRYSTQGFYNLSDSAYSRMSGYTVKPPTGDTSEQTLFIDYFNLFYSKRGQEQISISQQLGNYGTTFFSASRQSYWNTSRSDQQISFGLNVPFGDITTSLNYSYSNNIWQNDRDHLLAFTLNVPFSHWMRTDSQSAFHNSNASYSMSNDLKGGMTNLSGVYGTLLPDNNLNYSVQVGNTQGGNTSSGTSGYSSLNYRGAYGNTNVGYSRSGDSSQIYYGMSGGIIAHADGITFGQPLGDTMVLVKAPGADNVKIENQTGIHTDWRGYAILPFATEYRENRVALNANSLADNVELDETVVTVIPTHGAIARATFNAQIGGKVLMTLKYGNKSVPFGAIVTHGENKNGSIVAENGQVYLTGLPQSGKLQVSWGKDKNSNCIVDYKLPVVSPGTLLNQQTAICR